jgi:hypothetical protein
MNRQIRSFDRRLTSETRSTGTEASVPARRAVYRDRAPGVGYGNSSGYASERRYSNGWAGQARFRCG